MPQIVLLLTRLAGLAFVLAGMMSAGLVVIPRDLVAQLRRPRFVQLALGANFVVAPLLAWGLARSLPMKPEHAIGLMLVGFSAGAPFLPKLAEISRGSAPFAVSLMMLLVVGSVVVLPPALRLLLPGSRLPVWGIVGPLLLLVVLPLGAGLAVRRWAPGSGARIEPVLRRTANVSLALFVVLVVATHLKELWGTVGSFAILAAILFTLVLGAAAYALAGRDAAARPVFVLGTAQRNVAVALVVAEANFADQPDVRVMVLVVTVVSMVMILVAARVFRRGDGDAARLALETRVATG